VVAVLDGAIPTVMKKVPTTVVMTVVVEVVTVLLLVTEVAVNAALYAVVNKGMMSRFKQ
jgi:hypothetical protein